MIGYVTIGVSDMEKAKTFYTELLSDLGARVLMDMGRIAFIGKGPGETMLAICTPFNGQPCSAGNGTMIAIDGKTREGVDKLHAKAIDMGCQSEGDAGQRIPGKFYGGYFRDPDGNKLAFYHFG